MSRLIVTNGDAAIERLRAAGITDAILAWADALHDGPVPAGLPLEELSAVRASFLADDLGFPQHQVTADFRRRDAAIKAHAAYDTVELWFEHDLYDQLQLIQVLDVLSAEGRSDGVRLVQADDYLGPQSEAAIRALGDQSRPVTGEQVAVARAAWAAFTASTPLNVAQLARSDGDALPYLRSALRRLLAELPAPASGLSLTEERALAAVAAKPLSAAAAFKAVVEQEEAMFLGDASFFRRLDDLCFAAHKLIEGLPCPSNQCGDWRDQRYRAYAASQVAITEDGRAALDGRFDHAERNQIDRWLGGTHVAPGTLWRWDRETERLLAP